MANTEGAIQIGKSINTLLLKQRLEDLGAVMTNRFFVLTSGKYSNGYINARILKDNEEMLQAIGGSMANTIIEREMEIKDSLSEEDLSKPVVIVGPITMGQIFAEYTVRAGQGEFNNSSAWCRIVKDEAGKITGAEWDEGFDFTAIVNGARCYVTDDLLTTGGSIIAVFDLIKRCGGKVEGSIVLARRDQTITNEKLMIPWLDYLVDVVGFQVWENDDETCPLIVNRVPVVLHTGHGHEWIKNHEGYPVAE